MRIQEGEHSMKLNPLVTEDSISIWWEKPEAMEGEYRCYIDGKETGRTERTHFTYIGLAPDTAYTMEIRAEGIAGTVTARTLRKKRRLDVSLPPYNAIGDGRTMNTEALQRAFDDCTETDAVYIPCGVFLTGALRMHSHSELYIDEGGVIQGSAESKDYLPRIPSRFEGIEMECYSSVVNIGHMDHSASPDTEDIIIRGKGTIASGGRLLAERIIAEETERLRDYLSENAALVGECEKKETIPGRVRPRLVNISNARNVRISGLTLRDGASWNIHMIYSEDITVDHCTFRSEKVWNGDGWDPDSSERCTLFATEFYTGDDSVAIKSGKNPEGNMIARPTRSIRVFDCLSHSGHGIMIGSEISGGIEDVSFWDNDISSSSNGFEIKGTWKRGGYVRDIRIRDSSSPCVTIHSVPYNNDGVPAPDKPYFSNMSFENLDLSGIRTDNITGEMSQCPIIDIEGFDSGDHAVRGISFSGIRIPDGSKGEMRICNAVDVSIGGIVIG